MQPNRYVLNTTILTVLLLLGGAIMLAGCESPNPTKANILPDGYVWHDTTPLESPPETQPWIVEDELDPLAHNLSKEQWLHAADDLVTSLADQQGGLPSRLLLKPAGDGESAVMRGYDSYLRELLVTRNIMLTTDRKAASATLIYDVAGQDDSVSLKGANVIHTRTEIMRDFLEDLKGRPVLKLALALKRNGRTQAVARGLYHVHGQKKKRYEWALMPVPRYEEMTTTGTYND